MTTFASCSKDDDGATTDANKEAILGRWKTTKVEIKQFENNKLVREDVVTQFNPNDYWEYRKDMVFVDYRDDVIYSGTYDIKGNTLKILYKKDEKAAECQIQSITATTFIFRHVDKISHGGVNYRTEQTTTLSK